MKGLRWESVATALFFAAITIIAGLAQQSLRDLNRNVSELNLKMATVVGQINQNAKDTEGQKGELNEHTKTLADHEKRITILERFVR